MPNRNDTGNNRKALFLAALALAMAGLLAMQATPQTREAIAAARGGLDDINAALLTPLSAVVSVLPLVGAGHRARARITELEAQVRELSYWRDAAHIMSERIASYEKILELTGETPEYGVSARVVAEPKGPFAATRIANAGAENGIAVGYVAIGQNGLVGRVIRVGRRTSRILLLSDNASRIPVMGTVSQDRALLIGDGKTHARLRYAETPESIADGEAWITSGDAGLLPRGLEVGTARKNAQGWYLDLPMNRRGLDFVRLIPPSHFPPPEAQEIPSETAQ